MRLIFIVLFILLLFSLVWSIDIERTYILDADTSPISFIQTDDNGFLIYGYYDLTVFTRLDPNLDVVWRRSWDVLPRNTYSEKLIELPNGNYALVGNRLINVNNGFGESDFFVFEFTDDGDSLSYFLWDSEVFIKIYNAVPLDDGGYIFIAYIPRDPDHFDKEFVAIRVDSEREIIWEETLMRPGINNGLCSIVSTDDDCFLIGGTIFRTRPNYRQYGHIIKINIEGEILWQQTYTPSEGVEGWFAKILNISNGRYAAIGSVSSAAVNNNWYLEFDSNGEELVNRRITNLLTSGKRRSTALQNCDLLILSRIDDQYIPNDHHDGFMLVHINEGGDSLDSFIWPDDTLHNRGGVDLINTSDGGAAILGQRYFELQQPRRHFWRDIIIKIAPIEDNDIAEGFESYDFPHTVCLMPSYPNPFNSTTHISYDLNEALNIKVTISNTKGQQIAVLDHGERATGTYNLTWNADNVPSGIYFIKLITPTVKLTRKVLLVR